MYELGRLCLMEKNKERKKEEQNRNVFAFSFLNCEEKSWDSGDIFYIRIAKDFRL